MITTTITSTNNNNKSLMSYGRHTFRRVVTLVFFFFSDSERIRSIVVLTMMLFFLRKHFFRVEELLLRSLRIISPKVGDRTEIVGILFKRFFIFEITIQKQKIIKFPKVLHSKFSYIIGMV